MQQAAAARDSFLRAAGHTTRGSQALRFCAENALAQSLREGEAMSSTLEAQRWVSAWCRPLHRHRRCYHKLLLSFGILPTVSQTKFK